MKKMNVWKLVVMALVAAVCVIAVVGIVYNTRHIRIPYIMNKTEAEAKEQMSELDLDVQYVEEHRVDVEEGRVIALSINEGMKVKKGSSLIVTISKIDKVKVPNVVSLKMEEAKQLLENIDVKVELSEVYSEDVEAGVVIEQSLEENFEFVKGTTVDMVLKISKGSEYVEVPNVEKLDEVSAKKLLEDSLLSVVASNAYSSDIEAGKVISQSVTGGSKAKIGSEISLVISLGKNMGEIPNVVDKTKIEAEIVLKSAGIEVVIEEKYSEEYEKGDVAEQSLKAGSAYEIGIPTTIILTISKGSEYVEVPNVEMFDEMSAKELLEDKFLKAVIQKEYSSGIEEGKVISQSITAGSKVKIGSEISLTISMGKNMGKIPDVLNMSRVEAEVVLRSAGIQVAIEEKYSEEYDKGNVAAQSMNAGTEYEVGTSPRIVLTISKGSEYIEVPNVKGDDEASAKIILGNMGFGVTVSKEYSSTVGTGRVISQSVASGLRAKIGSTIELVISLGKKMGTVPNVLDMTRVEAEVVLKNAGIEYVIQEAYNEKYDKGDVAAQSLDAGKQYEIGTSITIVLTISKGSEYVKVPDVKGYSEANARSILAEKGFKDITVSTEYSMTVAEGNVISQSVSAETSVKIGSSINLVVSKGKQALTVTFNANNGTVSSTVTKYNGEVLGTLPTPTRDYYRFDGWFTDSVGGSQITSATKMGAENLNLYAHWTPKEESGWKPASEVPANAKITASKWTYTLTETMESTNGSESGWEKVGEYWSEKDKGSVRYASFPNGYDTSNWFYQNYNKEALVGYDDGYNKREVSNSWTSYIYWHWMYNVSYSNATNRTISHRKGSWNMYGGTTNVSDAIAWNYNYFCAFESAVDCPYLSNTYCCSQNLPSYNCVNVMPDKSSLGTGTPRFFRFDSYTSYYTDYQKIFQYKKVTRGIESATEVVNGDRISDVTKYVKYIER